MLLIMLQKCDVDFISKLLTGHAFHILSIIMQLYFITYGARNNNPSLHSSGMIISFSLFSINLLLMNYIIAYSMHHVWR